eukprot:7258754-Alexandrium_andersonii.AAC.1
MTTRIFQRMSIQQFKVTACMELDDADFELDLGGRGGIDLHFRLAVGAHWLDVDAEVDLD